MEDEWSFVRKLAVRLRQESAILILATLIAALALMESINTGAVFWIWAIVVVVALIRRPLVERVVVPSQAEREPINPEALLNTVFAGLAALDMPALIIDREASVLVQNAAVEKAFGAFPIGAHISSKLRSPGLLDMVRETIATNTPNQIEHSERLPSEREKNLRGLRRTAARSGLKFIDLAFAGAAAGAGRMSLSAPR